MILPIDRKINDRTPFVTYALIAINSAVLLWISFIASSEDHLVSLYKNYGYVPDHFKPHAILTHMFMHGGGVHLVANMVFLGFFGLNVERRLGPLLYLGIYLFSGLTSLGLFLLMNPTGDIPMVGASGAISGVTGMYLALYRSRFVTVFSIAGPFQTRAIIFVLFWAGIEIFNAIVMSKEVMVAHWAHVGGFFGGLGSVILLLKKGFKGYPEVPQTGPKNLSETFTQLKYIPVSKGTSEPGSSYALLSRYEAPLPPEADGLVPDKPPSHLVARDLSFEKAEELLNSLEQMDFPCRLYPQERTVRLPVMEIVTNITTHGHIGWKNEAGISMARDPDFVYMLSSGVVHETMILSLFLTSPWTEVRTSTVLSEIPLQEIASSLRTNLPGTYLSPGFISLSEGRIEEIPRFKTQENLDHHNLWHLQGRTI